VERIKTTRPDLRDSGKTGKSGIFPMVFGQRCTSNNVSSTIFSPSIEKECKEDNDCRFFFESGEQAQLAAKHPRKPSGNNRVAVKGHS